MKLTIREYKSTGKVPVKFFIEKIQDFVITTDSIKRIRRQPGFSAQGLKNTLKLVRENNGKIYIAEDDGKPIGYIFGFVCDKQSEENLLEVVPSLIGQIEDVYVEPEYRGKNIGKLLFNKMEQYLKEKGCDSIWLEVFASNTTAHAAYLKMGYTDREIGMLKKV